MAGVNVKKIELITHETIFHTIIQINSKPFKWELRQIPRMILCEKMMLIWIIYENSSSHVN